MAKPHPRVRLTPPATGPGAAPVATRQGTNMRYDWFEACRRLQDNPGVWLKMFDTVSTGVFSWASRGGPTAFAPLDGWLESTMRGHRTNPETGKGRVGEVWMRFEPVGWTADDQARAEAAATSGESQL